MAFAASVSGTASGLTSAVIAVVSSALFFLNHRATPGYDLSDLARMLLLAITAAGTAVITGHLRQKWIDAFASQRRHHATAERLRAALDQVDIGIVLLDADTRAEFINRAFRHYFSLPDEKANSRPPFIALMYHSRDTGAYELPEDELSLFIARRTEMMRSGNFSADQYQSQGWPGAAVQLHRVARRRANAELYAVTDLVRHTDDPGGGDYSPLAARRRRSRPSPGSSARRGIAAARLTPRRDAMLIPHGRCL